MALPYFSRSRGGQWLYPKDFNDWHLNATIRKLTAAVESPHPTTPDAEITRLRLVLEGLKAEKQKRERGQP